MLWNSLSFEIEASEEEEAHWRTLEACDLGRGGSSIRRHGGSSFGSSSSPVVDQGSSRSLVGACSKASRWSRSCKSRRRDETASGRPINPLFLKKIFTGTAVVVYLMAAIEMLYLSAHAMDFDTTGALLQEAEEESLRNSVLQLRRQIRKAEKKVKGKEKGENKKEKEEKEKGEQDGKKKEKKEKEDKEQEDEQDDVEENKKLTGWGKIKQSVGNTASGALKGACKVTSPIRSLWKRYAPSAGMKQLMDLWTLWLNAARPKLNFYLQLSTTMSGTAPIPMFLWKMMYIMYLHHDEDDWRYLPRHVFGFLDSAIDKMNRLAHPVY